MSQATIGSALVERRRELGLEKGRAADKIGMSRTTYSSYEQDAQRPSVDVFPALAGFLDVSMEVLLTLYGATCVAAVRPTLEKVLADHAGVVKEATNAVELPPVTGELASALAEEPEEIHREGSLDEPNQVVLERPSTASDRDTHDRETSEILRLGGGRAAKEPISSSNPPDQQAPELERLTRTEEPPAAPRIVRSSSSEPSTSIFSRELSDGTEQYPDMKKKKTKKKKKKS